MSRLTIDLGTAGNSATGDSIRAAFEKVNTNFSELYAELGGDSLDTLSFSNNTISSGVTNGTLVLTGNGTGAVDIEGIQINDNQIITTTSNTNLLLDGNGTGTVVINGLSFPIADGTAGQVLKTDGAGNLSFTNVDPGAITIVGDDSTGTAVNIGETFKIAGATGITTAVSGDTLTITGPDLSSYLTNSTITVVGDDSTGTTLNNGETIKIAGSGTVTTAVSGDTLTITGTNSNLFDQNLNTTDDVTFSSVSLSGVEDDSTPAVDFFTGDAGNHIVTLHSDWTLKLKARAEGANQGNLWLESGQNTKIKVKGNGSTIDVVASDGTTSSTWTFNKTGSVTFPDSTVQNTAARITVVGDDSTGVTLNSGETIKIAGTSGVSTAVSGDTLTITGPDLSSYLTSVPKIIDVNEISSSDSSAIQINDAINVSGALTANVINVGNTSGINFDGGSGGSYYAGQSGVPEASINKAGAYRTESSATNSLFTFGANGSGTMSVSVEGSMFIGTAMPSNNGGLSTAYPGWLVVQSGGKFGGDINTLGALKFDHSTNGYVQFYDGTVQSTARAMTIVGDDSTGTAVNIGETFKIAGAGSVTTSVSGDTLTITGSPSAQGITFVGDDSTGTQISDGETIKIAGTQNISTSMAADTLTITGPNLTNYAQKSDTAITIVGDDSTGTAITIGETFKIAGAGTVTTSVSGDIITITGSGGGASIGDLTVDGTTISSGSSSKITLNESVDITGTLQVNDINSADSTAIQINDGVNVSGTITATSFVTHGTGGSITGVNTLQVNEISSADSSAVQINDAVNISGTLTANTFVTNNISSSESSAIQVDDAINFAGAGTFHGSVRFNAGYTEKINALTSSSTITVNCALASVHTVTLAVNTGFVITNLPTGGSVTLIITQDGSGSKTATFGTDTSTTVKFPGGTPTLTTTASAIDVVTIFNDGTNYLGNIAKAYS